MEKYMNKLEESMLSSDIENSIKLIRIVKYAKILLALGIVIAYFFNFKWLIEFIIIAVLLNLLLPMNFFDVFIQKLLEYNTQKVEERILINANETNKYLEKNDKFKKSINDKFKFLKTKCNV